MPERRYVTIPETLSITLNGREAELPFAEFVTGVLLKDAKFGTKLDLIDQGLELRALFLDAEPGDELELRRNDWQILNDVLRNPSQPYNPEVLYQIREAYIPAITEAPKKSATAKESKEEKPKKEPKLKSA